MAESVAARFLDGLQAGAPLVAGRLVVVPLFGPPRGPEVDTLARAVAAGTAQVAEVSQAGRVNELGVCNRGVRPLLLLEGEELVGAKQNRVLAASILVAPGDALRVPVACVEQRRWAFNSPTLSPSGRRLRPDARTSASSSVTTSLHLSRTYAVDQHAVWSDVAAHARRRRVDSDTLAMSDIFDRDRLEIDQHLAPLQPQPGQVGAAVYIGDGFRCLDAFGRPETYAAHHDAIVRSAAAQAIESPRAADLMPPIEWVLRALSAAAPSAAAFKPPGLGTDLRLSSPPFSAAALALDASIIHLSAFRAP